MNPSTSSEQSAPQLPQPIGAEQIGIPAAMIGQAIPEAAPAAQERTPFPANGRPASLPTPALPIPSAPLPQISSSDAIATTSSAPPATADDTDLIEKEWVVRAKQIIKDTQMDPYQQSKQINVFKADYMKKRYNKTIKLGE